MRGRKHPKDLFTRTVSLRLPEYHYQGALAAAQADERSLSSWLRRLIYTELQLRRRQQRQAPVIPVGTSNSASLGTPTRHASCHHMSVSGTGLTIARCPLGCELIAA